MLSKLLSLGAIDPPMPLDEEILSPLLVAVYRGFVGVVRILLGEAGFRAIGGRRALPDALYNAVRFCRARMLRLLLAAEGEEKRSELANTNICDKHYRRLLHVGARFCCPAAVSILLEAGADEETLDSDGRIPLDGGAPMDRGKGVAIRRMLQRGPAYRARSWAWPSDAEEADDAGGSG
ncbi:unnamed protein product, partial [Laminaria digitata]